MTVHMNDGVKLKNEDDFMGEVYWMGVGGGEFDGGDAVYQSTVCDIYG